ncbi:hypothetical protein [Gordonia malaquae]|uniref:hypothetical protein n=1 Tax=Gordonia malaquae TaxID=410332 RepID=UPI0030193F86
MSNASDRQVIIDELSGELTSTADMLDARFKDLDRDWVMLSREEQFAAGSIMNARDSLRRAIAELHGDL